MSNILAKLFQPDDFVGIFFVVLVGFAYAWQSVGRTAKQANGTEGEETPQDKKITSIP